MILQKGANWFSITRDLAEYVVAQENWIHKRFSYTLSGDELFLQTLVYNSDFKNCLYQPRLIMIIINAQGISTGIEENHMYLQLRMLRTLCSQI